MIKRNLLAWLWALAVGLLLAHNAYLWLGKRIVPDTDILALLPVQQRDPVLQQSFSHMVDSAQQRLVVLVGADDWAQAGRAADAYTAVLAPHRALVQIARQVNDDTQRDWLALFQQSHLTLMTAQDQQALRDKPAQYWTDAALAKLYSPFGGPKLGAWQDDPFGLFANWVQERAQETPVRPRDGRLFVASGARQYVVLLFNLQMPAFSMTAQQAVMPLLEQARQAALHAVPQAELVTAGVVLHAAAASQQASGEASTIGIGSMLGVILLMWLTFKSLRPIALILLSIGIGCLGALSVCWLWFDRVHLMTLVFGASLIGVAQDYGIYFLCRRLGDAQLNSRQLLRRLMPGLLLTLATTVIGYMGLAFTPFPGLRQMALFSALGLVFAWLTVVFWFPSLVRADTLKGSRLVHWYGASLARWPLVGRNRGTAIAAVMFIVAAVFGLARLGVNDDIRLLQNPPKHLIDDQIKLGKLLDAPTPVQFYLVRGATAEQVLQREESLKQRLEPLIAQHAINGYQAISNWVPSMHTQDVRRQLLQQTLLPDTGPLAPLAAQIGEAPQWIAATRAHLLEAGAPLTVDAFLQAPASEPWRHLWLGRTNGVYASIVALRGVGNAALPLLRHTADGMEGVQWVDKVAEISSVLEHYREYMGAVLAASYLAVFCLLYARYRSTAWRVLAPAVVTTIATLAILGIAGQKLQLFHVLALMLMLGVGVDYGIFLHEHPDRRDNTAWLAVGLSALSTLLSFGLLALSRTPALQAFGLTMLLGTAIVWLIAPCFGKDTILERRE